MAKLRVYELARELSMENKVLLEKLREMNVEVKSHMSSLTDEAVERVKEGLFQPEEPEEIIEHKRIKPNVIRRRRKRVATKPAEPEIIIAEEPSDEPEKKEKPPVAEEEAPAEEEEKTDAKKATPKTKRAKKEKPEVKEPEAEEKKATEPVEAKKEEKAAEPEEKKPAKAKPKRKTKKGTPAKIISLPEKGEEKEPEPEKATEPAEAEAGTKKDKEKSKKAGKKKRVSGKPAPIVAPEPEADDKEGKKRTRKKKVLEPEKGKKVSKIKTALRRKEVIEGDALYDRSFGRARKSRKKGKHYISTGPEQKTQITTPKAIKRRIKIDDSIMLADLAKRMGVKANELIAKLMGMGTMVTVNQALDFDTASLVATEFSFEIEKASFEEEDVIKAEEDNPDQLLPRPPVVTIMGHVDHGKTSLLDVIRRTKVTEFEAGGITQHIGAYHVKLNKGEIVFLDTPGHEAFTSMRARGAHVTDLVVLVVAADDGVMPQTIEAIDHANAANVPIIVAVNKIDKADAEPDRIKRELAEQGLASEDWGGDAIFVNVSAKEKTGIDDLLEMILLQSEMLELKANPNKLARGHIIESKLDPGIGATATVLVKEGTLHTGDPIVCGMYYGKIRIMFNDLRKQVKEAGPSIPVEVVGLSGVPMAGDELVTLSAEKDAKQISEHRLEKQRSKELSMTNRLSLEKLFEKMQEGEVKDLNLIIKADVQGSIEALKESLTKLSKDEVQVCVIHSAVGPINDSDISLAAVSKAIILGFNVRPTAKVAALAIKENVDIRFYNIIYNALKEIEDALVGMMDAKFEEKVLGQAEVREVFNATNIGTIAGCYVTSGKMQRGTPVRVIRDGVVAYDSSVASLRRFKDDVKEVQQNYECGINVENFNDIKVGDVLECYFLEEVKPG